MAFREVEDGLSVVRTVRGQRLAEVEQVAALYFALSLANFCTQVGVNSDIDVSLSSVASSTQSYLLQKHIAFILFQLSNSTTFLVEGGRFIQMPCPLFQ